jgi:hypothetical protein
MTAPLPPLIVGVSGHRDADAAEAVSARRSIRDLLRALQETVSGRARLIAASALAAGADQLFALEALQIGVAVIAPLPMAPAEYRSTFADPRSVAEFDALAGRVTCFCVADWPDSPPLRTDLPPVDAAFQRLGDTLDATCSVLAALWDGAFNDSPGGTGDTVGRRLARDTLPAPLYWIPTSRRFPGNARRRSDEPFFVGPRGPTGELSMMPTAQIHRLIRRACDGARSDHPDSNDADSPADLATLHALRKRLVQGAGLNFWLANRDVVG